MIELLPHIDASLNALATILLVIGYGLIKRKRERAHKYVMITSFLVSVAFLICYLTYHFNVLSKKFPVDDYPRLVSTGYYVLLATHVCLAALVPWMAMVTIYLGLKDKRQAHRRLARWTFPIWLYVSVTGVLVYLILYWLCPPR